METLTLFSSIKAELLRQQLMRGSMIAGVGAIILIFGGTWVPQASLSFWGLPLFFAGMGLITWGMLPYRRLKQLESNPYVVKIENNMMYCYRGGKEIYRLDIKEIERASYVDDDRRYGIDIEIKSPENRHLFLPYFSKNSYQALTAQIE